MKRTIRILWALLEVNQLLWVLLLVNSMMQSPPTQSGGLFTPERLLIPIGFLFATGAQIWAYNMNRRIQPRTAA